MIEQAHTEKKNDTPFRDALENAIATSPDREKLKAALEAPEQERNGRKAAKGEPEPLQIIPGVPRPGDEGVDESYVWKPSGNIEAFRKGLRDLGYVEGRNITLEIRYGDGLPERLP